MAAHTANPAPHTSPITNVAISGDHPTMSTKKSFNSGDNTTAPNNVGARLIKEGPIAWSQLKPARSAYPLGHTVSLV